MTTGAGEKLPQAEGNVTWSSAGGALGIVANFELEEPPAIAVNLPPGKEPNNLMLPVLAGRRVNYYREQASRDQSVTVMPQDSNLVSRIMPLVGSSTPQGVKFARLCKEILHVNLQVLPGDNGQSFLGVQVDLQTSIPLESMGAGLSGALSLLVGLCTAEDKLFVIEEPEDDLHPAALKALLDAITEAALHNQFLISTHSSIVLTRLGALPDTVVVHVTSDEGLPPTTTFQVKHTAEDRMEILRDLGYSLADISLGEGWLIFEESTAERLVYQWLAPWFAPGLLTLRHVSARGNGRIRSLMTHFKDMFLFAHLEPMYKQRAWVILDGDEQSTAIIERLRSNFADWPNERFRQWPKDAIEQYYPSKFAETYHKEILAITDHRKRQEAKQELFRNLVAWIEEDHERAKKGLQESAAEMITVLQEIEKDLAVMSC